MYHKVTIVAISNILCALHGFSNAVPRHYMAASHDLASLRPFHLFQRESGKNQQLISEARASDRYVPGGRGLIDLFKSSAVLAGDAAIKAHQLILPPLKGVEWIAGKATNVQRLKKKVMKKILKGIAGTAEDAWKVAEGIEFPGKSIVALVLPTGVAIADKLTNDVVHFATNTKNAIKATVAHSLYAALKVIFSVVDTAISQLGLSCIPINKTSLQPNVGLVNTIDIGEGTICGLDSLYPKKNVTITKDTGKFMVIKMPWAFKNLVVKIKSVDIEGWMGTIAKDQPVETTVAEIDCQGTISLQKGTFLQFVAIHFELEEITGVNITLVGGEEGMAAGVLNGLSGALGGIVKNLVNSKLLEMEKHISDYLLGNERRK